MYVFGYGSLICPDSRSRTSSSGPCIPVRVDGLQRGWYCSSPVLTKSSVGVIHERDSQCNGVLFSLSERELRSFDRRELKHGYQRIEIPIGDVQCLNPEIKLEGSILTYALPEPALPTENHQIAQSYVDVILSGCLGIGESFAAEFIRSTAGWCKHWIDDRQQPIYSRALRSVPQRERIDRILSQIIPGSFELRRGA